MSASSRGRRVSLLSEDAGGLVTGGHLYNRRMAEQAVEYGVSMEIVAVNRHFNLSRATGQVVVDGLVASELWTGSDVARLPSVTALVHQAPGGVDGDGHSRRADRWADLAFYKSCDLVIAASPYLRGQLTTAGISEETIRIVAPGCDIAPVEPGPVGDMRSGSRLAMINVANWVPNKGIHLLLDAVEQIPTGEAVLHLVGSTELDPIYAKTIWSRVGEDVMRGKVVVHGALPQHRLSRLYAAADLFVLSSRDEGYPTVVAEALGFGLPVVAWRSGNLPNLVESGNQGFLITPGDVGMLTVTIRRLAQDDGLRSRLARNAAIRGATLPTWRDAAERFFTALAEVADRGGG